MLVKKLASKPLKSTSQNEISMHIWLVDYCLRLSYAREYCYLLHIMCGYQCDNAVTKIDTGEVISFHSLNCPIK